MENFDAKQARFIVNSTRKNELNEILDRIKKNAELGLSSLTIHEVIRREVVQGLEDKGFVVESSPSSTYYCFYTISW